MIFGIINLTNLTGGRVEFDDKPLFAPGRQGIAGFTGLDLEIRAARTQLRQWGTVAFIGSVFVAKFRHRQAVSEPIFCADERRFCTGRQRGQGFDWYARDLDSVAHGIRLNN